MIFDDDFVKYMGYRDTVIDDKVNECLREINAGKTSISVDAGDLTDSEIEEVKRRLDKKVNKW